MMAPVFFTEQYNSHLCYLFVNIYRPHTRGDSTSGSIRVCVSVRLSVGALIFDPFDL